MLKRIGFAGTFDPITKGHLWVIEEAEQLADEVVILIAQNNSKQHMFSVEQRKVIIEQSLLEGGYLKSKVEIVDNEYTATYAKSHNIDYLIRGIRSTVDFDYENVLQQANTSVLQGAKTLFVMPPRDLGSVSSSFVKSLIGPKGWQFYIKQFLTDSAFEAIELKYLLTKYETKYHVLLNMLFEEKNYHILTMDLIQVLSDIESLKLSEVDTQMLKTYYLYKELFHSYEDNLFIESNGKIEISKELNMSAIEQLLSNNRFRSKQDCVELIKADFSYIQSINQFVLANRDVLNQIETIHAKMIVDHYK